MIEGHEHPPAVSVYNKTDVGNAERLIARFGASLHYCHLWGKWLVWNSARWKVDERGEAEKLAKETVRGILAEALELEGTERTKLVQHALASERSARIRGLLEMAESQEGVPVVPDELDADHWVLNLHNGTLDLRSLELHPHSREALCTKLAPVDYDPDATAPRWARFLEEVFAGDTELVAFVQRAVGYSLTGDTSAQVLFILHGSGSNGKSTFLEILAELLGDYAQQAPADTFLEKRYGGIPNDVAMLKGARFVTAAEVGEQRRLDEASVKRMTGGDRLSARFMRAEWFHFRPLFKIWLATNHLPQIRGTDKAIWRRIRLIPFGVTFPPESRDEHLKEKLRAELPGILNWALEGCRDWFYGDGLEPPAAVQQATEVYRAGQDLLGAFLEECTREQVDGRTKAADLYKAYQGWCEATGERERLSQTGFGLRLRERGFISLKSHGRAVWDGLRLVEDRDLFDAEGENSDLVGKTLPNPPRGANPNG